MNGLDIAIGVSCLAAFVGGYRAGLVSRVTAWLGLFLGLLLAAKNVSALTARFTHGSTRRPGAVLAVLVGGAVLGRVTGLIFGRWVQNRLPTRPVRTVNRLAGGGVGLLGVLVTVWLVTPLLAFVPGWPAEAARRSVIATSLSNNAPFRVDVVASVRRLLASGRLPQAVSRLQPALSGTPPEEVAMDTATRDAVSRSVRLVQAVACGVESDGTAFAISAHRLVTNAHVVAGAKTVSISDGGDDLHPATVIAFDPSRDLAVLETAATVPSLTSLALSDETASGELAVFGHPSGGPLVVSPAVVQSVESALGRDIYDERESTREVVVLAAVLHPGDSGGPVTDGHGRVVGVAFAIAPDRPSTAYALAVSELRSLLDTVGTREHAAALGPCLQ